MASDLAISSQVAFLAILVCSALFLMPVLAQNRVMVAYSGMGGHIRVRDFVVNGSSLTYATGATEYAAPVPYSTLRIESMASEDGSVACVIARNATYTALLN